LAGKAKANTTQLAYLLLVAAVAANLAIAFSSPERTPVTPVTLTD